MDNNNNNSNSSKQILLSVLGVAILVVAVVGVSFAAFTFSGEGSKENTVSTGTISLSYTEHDKISITNAMPMSDAEGKVLAGDGEKFTFTVTASISGTVTINYEIAAIKKEPTDPDKGIANSDIRLYLTRSLGDANEEEVFAPAPFDPSSTESSLGSPVGSMVLASGQYTATMTDNYILRMWLAEDYVIPNSPDPKTFTVTVNVYAKAV